MGMRTYVLVLLSVCAWVFIQLCVHLHSYGYSYSGNHRIENCEEDIQPVDSPGSRVFVVEDREDDPGVVDTMRNYWKGLLAVFEEGAKQERATYGPALINSGKMIIYAKYRTGSTFTSQFFFEHQNISYMFEPLRLEGMPDYAMVDDGNAILWDMLACKFYTNQTKRILPTWKNHVMFCQITGQTPGCIHGKPFSVADAWRHCDGAAIRAAKVIRIRNIWQLEEFLQNQVKVVHVVRDPRGIAHSRSRLHSPSQYEGKIEFRVQEYCQEAVDDIRYIRRQFSLDERLVRHVYHVVRYEDLARDARQEMERLYQFIGLPPDDKLLQWVAKIDHDPKSNRNGEKRRKTLYDHFGTDRAEPAHTVSVAWRRTMPFSTVLMVQKHCAEFMELAGYLPFNNTQDFTNMSLPVLKNLDKEFILKGA